MSERHKVFISYHHANDEYYKTIFEQLFHDIYETIITRSVQLGDIDPVFKTETIRQKIRDEFLRDSTVTVVLIGTETWKRKHVDWEISSSIRDTRYNSRSGLVGILLPTRLDYQSREYTKNTIPPRLYDNQKCGFAKIYNWTEDPIKVKNIIHQAFQQRKIVTPDNSRPLFKNNRPQYQTEWQS